MKIYEHLTPFTKCRKEILIKQTKSLVFDDDQRRLRQLVNK